jgi:hypothetical protein
MTGVVLKYLMAFGTGSEGWLAVLSEDRTFMTPFCPTSDPRVRLSLKPTWLIHDAQVDKLLAEFDFMLSQDVLEYVTEQ